VKQSDCGTIAVMRLVLTVALLASTAFAADRPLYVEAALEPADLEGRSLRELTLMRNWIYAKRGNEFRRAWLKEFFSKQPWYQPNQAMFLNGVWKSETEDPPEVWRRDDKNAETIATYESSLTVEKLTAMRDTLRAKVKANKKAAPEELVELKLLSIRLGEWAGEGDAPADLNPLENPSRLDKLLSMKDLDDLSPRDLKLLRNTIFARRGRAFETPLVKGHFTTIKWYAIDPKYTDAKLTDVDKKNVKLIQSLEKQLKRENEQNYMVAA